MIQRVTICVSIDGFDNNLGKYPQSLIEKSLKSGKIKINTKKVKSSHKVKTGDVINIFNFDFKETIVQKTIKFDPIRGGY